MRFREFVILLAVLIPFSLPGSTDVAIISIEDLPSKVCENSITPSLIFENQGTDPIQTIEIFFIYDNGDGPSGLFIWTGNEAAGNIWQVPLPTTTISTGPHLLDIQLFSVNGQADDNPFNDVVTTSFYSFLEGDLTLNYPEEVCQNGNALLQATSSIFGLPEWYQNETDVFPLYRGLNFVTPNLTQNTTYYVDLIQKTALGEANYSIGSAGFGNPPDDYFIFNAYQDIILRSVKIFTNQTGSTQVELRDSSGGLLAEIPVQFIQGEQTVELDLYIPCGAGHRLGLTETNGIVKNTSGASYPYSVLEVVEIIGSKAGIGAADYPYLYDWKVEYGRPCGRERIDLVVGEEIFEAAFEPGDTILPAAQGATVISYHDLSQGATSWNWIFGEGGTSEEQDPVHTFQGLGTFTVIFEATGPFTCSDVATSSVTIQFLTSIEEANKLLGIEMHPNPTMSKVNVRLTHPDLTNVKLSWFHSSGVLVEEREYILFRELLSIHDTSDWPSGIYFLHLQYQGEVITKKLIKN